MGNFLVFCYFLPSQSENMLTQFDKKILSYFTPKKSLLFSNSYAVAQVIFLCKIYIANKTNYSGLFCSSVVL